MSHLKKPLTLTYFFLLIGCFVAYRAGAFHFSLFQQGQKQINASAQDTATKQSGPYSVSNKKLVPLSDPSRHLDSNVRKSIQRVEAQDQKDREMIISSSKSAVVFPVEVIDNKRFDSLFRKTHKDTVIP